MTALNLSVEAARGIGLTIALAIVIGRAAYRRLKRRRVSAENRAEQADPFGESR